MPVRIEADIQARVVGVFAVTGFGQPAEVGGPDIAKALPGIAEPQAPGPAPARCQFGAGDLAAFAQSEAQGLRAMQKHPARFFSFMAGGFGFEIQDAADGVAAI